jgi:nucleotide-binding universal stress UspA family protein
MAMGGGDRYFGKLEPDSAELWRMLQEIHPTDPLVACEHQLLRGEGGPAEKIVQLAKEEEVDLIVIGSHGRRGMSRRLMGTVAEAVARGAPCPVLIMRPHARTPTVTL